MLPPRRLLLDDGERVLAGVVGDSEDFRWPQSAADAESPHDVRDLVPGRFADMPVRECQ